MDSISGQARPTDQVRAPADGSDGLGVGDRSIIVVENSPVSYVVRTSISGSEVEEEDDASSSLSDSSSLCTTCSDTSHLTCTTAIRMAGWLVVKNWLVRKKRKIVPATRRRWKRYWVLLRGTRMLLYVVPTDRRTAECTEPGSASTPEHVLVVRGSLAQPLPEHPKKDNVFAVCTNVGDAFLFQASCPADVDRWIGSIHSACAVSLAPQTSDRDDVLRMLEAEIEALDVSVEQDRQMKKMADLQLGAVVDQRSRVAISRQMAQWDTRLERHLLDQYQLQCYAAALRGTELPNPKPVLAYASRESKSALCRVNIPTCVIAFYALVSARTPSSRLLSASRMMTGDDTRTVDVLGSRCVPESSIGIAAAESYGEHRLQKVHLPLNQTVLVEVTTSTTVSELLRVACSRRQLDVDDHFVRLRTHVEGHVTDSTVVPDGRQLVDELTFDVVEVCLKTLRQVALSRQDGDTFGLTIEAELVDDGDDEDELRLFVYDVVDGGVAARAGLAAGDEILIIDGRVVGDLDISSVDELLRQRRSICLTVRSCDPVSTGRPSCPRHSIGGATNSPGGAGGESCFKTLICPPPPSTQRWIDDSTLGQLIIPPPTDRTVDGADDADDQRNQGPPRDQGPQRDGSGVQPIDRLLKGADQVTQFCHLSNVRRLDDAEQDGDAAAAAAAHDGLAGSDDGTGAQRPGCDRRPGRQQLSQDERIQKVVVELISTERQYVRDLNCLVERYLEPLKDETFLSADDVMQLFGNVRNIIEFQQQFLASLSSSAQDDRIQDSINLSSDVIQVALLSISKTFQFYSNHFRLYSSFCASHSRAIKLLASENRELDEFLRARNPKCQHSASLESFLIKPIQRVLKYPLLLRQLVELTADHLDVANEQLRVALRAMESVAEYINEMQKIHDEYGDVFDDLLRQRRQCSACTHRQKDIDLNPSELMLYGSVCWLNAPEVVCRTMRRAGSRVITELFVFKTCAVMVAIDMTKDKRKYKGRPPPVPQSPTVQTSADHSPDATRWATVIPLDELIARTPMGDESPVDERRRVGVWELVHCRSETEGRPETVYQLASTDEIRRECVRLIHQLVYDRRGQSPNRMRLMCRQLPGGMHKALGASRSQPDVNNVSTKANFGSTTRRRNSSVGTWSPGASPKVGDREPAAPPPTTQGAKHLRHGGGGRMSDVVVMRPPPRQRSRSATINRTSELETTTQPSLESTTQRSGPRSSSTSAENRHSLHLDDVQRHLSAAPSPVTSGRRSNNSESAVRRQSDRDDTRLCVSTSSLVSTADNDPHHVEASRSIQSLQL